MIVPSENLYYMLCYAWDVVEARSLVDRGSVPAQRPVDLFAKVLAGGLRRVLRRGGLHRSYVTHEEETSRPRGRILLERIARRPDGATLRLPCRVDELSPDGLHNRIIKATLLRLARCEGLDARLVHEMRALADVLHDVTEIALEPACFRRVVLHRNNTDYALLMHVCELVDRRLLPTGSAGRSRFLDYTGDDREMGALFETFVLRFLSREQRTWRARAERLGWSATAFDPGDLDWLPALRTDVTLRAPGRLLVIECKCTGDPRPLRHGRRRLRSAHLSQLHAYLSNQAVRAPRDEVGGLLLYATTGVRFVHDYVIQGRRVRVAALDVAQDWRAVHDDLLGLVASSD